MASGWGCGGSSYHLPQIGPSMRRSLALGGVLLSVALVVGPASLASASTVPPPPPVTDPVYDLPSTWISEEEAQLRKHEIDLARRADSAKFWTRPVNLTTLRGVGGAAGAAWLAFDIAFQVTSAGIQVAGVIGANATGDVSYYCQNYQAYQGTSWLTMVGPLADCPTVLPFAHANSDQMLQTALVYQGTTRAMVAGTGDYGYTCFYSQVHSGTLYLQAADPANSHPVNGTWYNIDGYTGGLYGSANCGGFWATRPTGFGTAWAPIPLSAVIRLYDDSTGQVIATGASTRANPSRQARCTYNFTGGLPSVSSDWVGYTDDDGFPADEFAAACDSTGSTLTPSQRQALRSVGVEERTDGGSITEIAESEVPDEMAPYQEQMTEPGTGRKALTLTRTVNGIVVQCLTSGNQCADWWADTSEGTVTDQYRCYYGAAEVALAECSVYRNSFQPGLQTPVITDPQTGEDVQWGGGTNPSNSINPGVGPGTSPGDACMAGWSSAPNPLEWVLHPVKCALVWAFVPRAEKVAEARARTDEAAGNTAVATVGTALASLGVAFDAGVGCGGLPFHLEGPGWEVNTFLLESCTEPAAGIAATVRTILTVAIIIGGILAFTRYLGSLFGFQAFGRNNSERSGGPSFD